VYRAKLPVSPALDTILEAALCPYSLFDDNFDNFVQARAAKLTEEAKKLIA
jgi:hypothetical protein